MLALAYHVEERIEAGAITDYSAAAAALGITRARLSQVASLLLLSPEIQDMILAAVNEANRKVNEAVKGKIGGMLPPGMGNLFG